MSKREFIMQFVLNRAAAGNIATSPQAWVIAANEAWNEISKIAPPSPSFGRSNV